MICFLVDVYGQRTDTVAHRQGILIGFNQFPGYYVPWETHNINEVPWGYNCGYFREGNKLNIRCGVNGNIYKRKGSPKANEFDIGLEVGAEVRLLSCKRKWICNAGLIVYQGWHWSYVTVSPINSSVYLRNEWGLGPDLLVGRRIKNRWILTTEYSISLGTAIYSRNGQRYDEKIPAYELWKWFGIGCRYYLN